MSTKKLLLIFLPALLVAGLALFIRILQYEPLFPKPDKNQSAETTKLLQIPIFPDDPIVGSKKAGITLVAFEDFGCSHCQQQNSSLNEVQKKYPNRVKIIWKGLPVARFPFSTEGTNLYSYCADRQQKFNEFKEYAFANSDNLSETTLKEIIQAINLDEKDLADCVASPEAATYIERTKQLARVLNVQAVPAFFIENKQIAAPQSVTEWELLLSLKVQ